MKHVFILNSFSDYNTNDVANRIIMACVNKGYDYVIEENNKDKSTEDILKKYKNTHNIIYAVGGDGMINRVLNGIVNTNNILGYIPYGTGNDLNRTILEDKYSDLIHNVNLVKINDKYFINVACFGIDADISNDDKMVHNKYILKSQRYNIAALSHFLSFKAKEFEVVINGKIINSRFSTIAVCNAKYYGGGYKIAPNALINDDLLDVYLVDELTKLKLAKTILEMKKGQHEEMIGVNKYNTSRLLIFAKNNVKANIDGEVLEDKVFDIRLCKNDIKLSNDQDLIRRIKRL